MTDHRRELLTQASEAFNPNEVKTFDTLNVPEHLTAIVHIPDAIRNKLAKFAYALHEQEPSLLLVRPENYHITIASAPLETGVDHFKEVIGEALHKQKFELDLSGVLLDPEVIAAVAYPNGQELYALRKQIFSALGEVAPEGLKSELGWASIARFTKPPSSSMVDLALKEIQRGWGHFNVDSAVVYRTANKHLDESKEIATLLS